MSKADVVAGLLSGVASFGSAVRTGVPPVHLDFSDLTSVVAASEEFSRLHDQIAAVLPKVAPEWASKEHLYKGRFVIPMLEEYALRTRYRMDRPELLTLLVDEYLAAARLAENEIYYRALVWGGPTAVTFQIGEVTYRPPTADEESEFVFDLQQKGFRIPQTFSLFETRAVFSWNEGMLPDGLARERIEASKLVVAVAGDCALSEPFALATTWMHPFHRSWRVSGGEYRLPTTVREKEPVANEIQRDVDLLSRALSGINRRELLFVMRRYAGSLDRSAIEDQLVDAWIVLESIYSESSTEIAHKVSFRIASTLASSGAEAEDLFRFLKRTYSLRSMIVHGNSKLIDATKVRRLRGLSRSAVLALAVAPERFDPASIDLAVLRRGPLRSTDGSAY